MKIPTTGILSKLETYSRKGFSNESLGKSDGEEITCDFFSLRDIWTAPSDKQFDALVDEFVEIYAFYLTTIGVDGLRIDTVKHVHPGFWDAFTERLRKKLGDKAKDKLFFGEVYDTNPEKLGSFTWRSDWPKRTDPALDSVLDFAFCDAVRTYLRAPGGSYGSSKPLEEVFRSKAAKSANGRPLYNPNPGPDGLNAVQKSITFIENHDGLNRFRVNGVTERRNLLAQVLVLASPGIPCLYYGTEFGQLDDKGRIGQDGETGRMSMDLNVTGKDKAVRDCETFVYLRVVSHFALAWRDWAVVPLWSDSPDGPEDDGVFAFARVGPKPGDFVIIVVNASDSDRVTAAGKWTMRLVDANGKALIEPGNHLCSGEVVGTAPKPKYTKVGESDGLPTAKIAVPAQSLILVMKYDGFCLTE